MYMRAVESLHTPMQTRHCICFISIYCPKNKLLVCCEFTPALYLMPLEIGLCPDQDKQFEIGWMELTKFLDLNIAVVKRVEKIVLDCNFYVNKS